MEQRVNDTISCHRFSVDGCKWQSAFYATAVEKPVLVHRLQIRESSRRKAQNSARWTRFVYTKYCTSSRWLSSTNFKGTMLDPAKNIYIILFTIHKWGAKVQLLRWQTKLCRMEIYVYVYMCIYNCVYIYVYICIHRHICINIYIYIYTIFFFKLGKGDDILGP